MKAYLPAILLFFITYAARAQPQLMLQTPHETGVDYGFISHDGRFAYSVSLVQNEVKIWEVASGKLLRNVPVNSTEKQFYLLPTAANNGMFLLKDITQLSFLNEKLDTLATTNWVGAGTAPIAHHDEATGTLIFDYSDKKYYDVWDIATSRKLISRNYGANRLSYEQGVMTEIINESTLLYYDLARRKMSDTIRIINGGFGYFSKPVMNVAHYHIFYRSGRSINCYDVQSKKESVVLATDSSLADFTISADESYLLAETMTTTMRFALKNESGAPVMKEQLSNATIKNIAEQHNWLAGKLVRYHLIGENVIYNIESNKRYRLRVEPDDIGHWGRSKDFDYNATRNLMAYTLRANNNKPSYKTVHNAINVFDATTGDSVLQLSFGDNFTVSSVNFTPDGNNLLLTGTANTTSKGYLLLCNLKGRVIWQAPSQEGADGIYNEVSSAIVVNDSIVLTQMTNFGYKLWNLAKGTVSHFGGEIAEQDVVYPYAAVAESSDSCFIIRLTNVVKNTTIDTFHITYGREPYYAIGINYNTEKKEIFFKTISGLYRIDVAARTVKMFPIGGDSKISYYSKDTLIVDGPMNSAAYNIADKNAVTKITCEKCFKQTDHQRTISIEQDGTNEQVEVKIKSYASGRLIQSFKLAGSNNYANKGILDAGVISNPIFSADDQWLAMVGSNQIVVYKKGSDGRFSFTYIDSSLFTGIEQAAFSNDSKKLYYTNSTKKIMTLNLANNQLSALDITLPAQLSQIEFTPNSRKMVLLCEGNFIVLYDLVTQKVTGVMHESGREDVETVLPTGYYSITGKPSGKIGFVSWPHFYPFEQLDVQYNRPDKVLTAFGTAYGKQDTQLINAYHRAWQKRVKKLGIDTAGFSNTLTRPESDIKNRDAIVQKGGSVSLIISAKDSSAMLNRFNVWVNEVPVFGMRGADISQLHRKELDTVVSITLSAGMNRIETSVTNATGMESYRVPLYVIDSTPRVKPAKLYFIGIGIEQFKSNDHSLHWCTKDINDLAAALKKMYGNNISIDTLYNQNVTRGKIKELKKKLRESKVDDKVIIAYSGHGLLSKSHDYYLSTYDVNFDKPEDGGLPYDELEWLVDSIPSRNKLMLIDACHSGELDKDEVADYNRAADSATAAINGLKAGKAVAPAYKTIGINNSFELMQTLFANVGRSTGATIIAAATGTQFSLEKGALQNGVFTYSILELMRNQKAAKVSELKSHVVKRVTELTNGHQTPTSRNEMKEFDWQVW